jgi:hypothetical protein
MFAPKDQKALFRVGSKVTVDFLTEGKVFKVTGKIWDVNGSLLYKVTDNGYTVFARQKDLNKA